MYNISELIKKAELCEAQNKFSSRLTGKYSMSIVYSEDNSKRIALNKTLVEALDLKDSISVLCIPSEGIILLSGTSFSPSSSPLKISGKGRKTLYNAEIIRYIIEEYAIDYSSKCSHSFKDIRIDEHNGIKIATVVINSKDSVNEVEEEVEPSNEANL